MNPIVLIPGITGSRLVARGRMDQKQKQVWFPNMSSLYDDMVEYLWGSYDQVSQKFVSHCDKEYEIMPVPGINGCMSLSAFANIPFIGKSLVYFQSMVKFLQAQRFTVIAFTYDWRQDPCGQYIQQSLNAFLQEQSAILNCTQFNFICHSMGGVILNHFLQQNASKADKIVFLGTPFNGSNGQFLNAFQRGYNLKTNLCRQIFRGFLGAIPAVYALIPFEDEGAVVQVKGTINELKQSKGCKKQIINENKPKIMVAQQKAGSQAKQIILDQLVGKEVEQALVEQLVKKGSVKNIFADENLINILQFTEQQEAKYTFSNIQEFYELSNQTSLQHLFKFDPVLHQQVQQRQRYAAQHDHKDKQILIICGSGQQTDHSATVNQLFVENPTYTKIDGDGTVSLESQMGKHLQAERKVLFATHSELKGKVVFKDILEFLKQ
ncbi:Lecithin-cholesterol_acyltransferase [Hexamita inflata]|uniref:Lecithin-cholesterol acyltransferase n=1 Tax=Hexamita inflata TaxID=28002 RepID=A0AA86RCL3_9EUKA|nr:Lecithin-cholesterol acyltransferase [Hexamita inflata]